MPVPFPLLPRRVRWAGVVLAAVLIFYVSALAVPPEQPLVVEPPDLIPLDKWRHFLGYAAFGSTLAYATADWEWPTLWLVALVVGVTAGYGVGIELVQAPLERRYMSVGDAYANALGGVLVVPWFAIRPYLSFVRIPGEE